MELLGGQIFFAHFKVISDGFLGKSFKKISRAEQVIFSGRAHLKHQNMAKQSVEKYNSALFLACNFTIVVQESGEMILLLIVLSLTIALLPANPRKNSYCNSPFLCLDFCLTLSDTYFGKNTRKV